MFFNFVFENILACAALLIMMVSLYFQLNHIKFKRQSIKQLAKITDVITKGVISQASIEYNYKNKTYLSKALFMTRNFSKGQEIEILVNPLEMMSFEEPTRFRKTLNKISVFKKDYPRILMQNPLLLSAHFALMIVCLLLISFN